MAAFDQAKFEALQGRVMGNVGGAVGLLLAYMGDQVGLYKALEESGGVTSEKLATFTRHQRAVETLQELPAFVR